MSNRYHGHYREAICNSMHYFLNPNEMHERQVQLELERQYGPEHDPDKPPPMERGDKYIMIGTTIGVILGGGLGGFLGSFYNLHLLTVIFCVFGGIVVGGLLGAIIGIIIKRRVLNKKLEPKQIIK
jgi:hypothetical protein